MKKDLDYNVIATGSGGNAVRIENILMDAGIPYSKLKNELNKVKYVVYTHKHTDHFNLTTYLRIRENFPYIQVIGNWEIGSLVKLDHIINAGYPIQVGEYLFNACQVEHDVLTYAYYFKVKGYDVLFATDLANTDSLPNKKFDYIFLESNYDEDVIKQVKNKHYGRYYPYLDSTTRHLSRQQNLAYFYIHKKDTDSELVELHMSKRFYS